MPKEQEQGSSVSTVTVNDDSGTAISPSITGLIKSSVAESIGALTDNLTQIIKDRLGGFAKRFSDNSSTVEQAVKKARQESYTCKRKGNQQQLDHPVQVLDKFDEASDALKAKLYDKVKAALDSGTEVVSKRIQVIKMADKSDFGWSTVNEYLLDELASNSDDEKRMYRVERRAERKTKRKDVVVSGPRIERNRRLLLVPLFLPVQDLPIQQVVSLIEGFLARSIFTAFGALF